MSTFNPPADIAQITLAKSSDVNAVKAATAIAFGLLPSETKLQRGTVNFAVDTGTVNAYVVALDASITTYTDGLQVVFRPLNDNTGSATINLNSLGAKSIRLTDSEPIQTGDTSAGGIIEVRYSTATGFFHLAPNSAIYAHDAGVSATAAAASASTASTSASNAATSASNAASSASTASTQASNASTSATNAASSATAAAASFDSFDDRYLGSKTSDPTLDNDGNALLTGALYWNTTSGDLRAYTGSTWISTWGFKNIPQTGTDKTTAYTLTTGDVGKYVGVGTSGSIVVPTSTFANGDAISVFNNTTGNITITTSAPTAYIGGTNTVKTSITLATRGIATILFVSATVCVVTGNIS